MTDAELRAELDKRFEAQAKDLAKAFLWQARYISFLWLLLLIALPAKGSTLPPPPLPLYADLPAGTDALLSSAALTQEIQSFPEYAVYAHGSLIGVANILPNVVEWSPEDTDDPVQWVIAVQVPGPNACYTCVEPRHGHVAVTPEPHYRYLVGLFVVILVLKVRFQ